MTKEGLMWKLLIIIGYIAVLSAPALAVAEQRLELEITGLQGEIQENVRALLNIAEFASQEAKVGVPGAPGIEISIPGSIKQPKEDFTEAQLQRRHQQAPDEIRQALQPFGYYSPQIKTSLTQDGGVWKARYQVDLGPPTIIRKVMIEVMGEGQNNPTIQRALKSRPFKEGERLKHRDYETFKQDLLETAFDAGFLDAKYAQSEIRVIPERQRAELILKFDTGGRFYFGEIDIQQDILQPQFINRFVQIKPGEPFEPQKLLDLQLALSNADYFRQVEVQADRKQAVDHHIPVTVITKPQKPQRYSVGLGYGTDTGPRLTLGVELRRINRRGHQFRADLRLSEIQQAISAQYSIPIENVATDRLTFIASTQQEKIGDADTKQYLIGSSRNEGWRGFQRRLYLNLLREDFDFGEEANHATILFPGVSLARKRADAQPFVRKGYSLNMDLRGGAEQVLSDVSFLRTVAGVNLVRPLSDKARLLLRSDLGALEVDMFDKLPPSQRFFAGGARSVRGYGYQNIGSRNEDDKVIGGRYLIVGSIEIDYLFYKDFGAAAFFDMGDAPLNISDTHFKRGVGLGFRWRAPIGMVRVDFAHPLDDPEDDFEFHLSIGADL